MYVLNIFSTIGRNQTSFSLGWNQNNVYIIFFLNDGVDLFQKCNLETKVPDLHFMSIDRISVIVDKLWAIVILTSQLLATNRSPFSPFQIFR